MLFFGEQVDQLMQRCDLNALYQGLVQILL